jgi:hypothetical protein
MKLVGVLSTAVLSLTLGMAIPAFAQQDQHDQQDEQKDKAAQDEKKAQPDKPKQEDKNAQQQDKTKQEEEKKAEQDKNAKPEEKKAEQQDKDKKQEEKNVQPAQHAQGNGGGRIPEDRYKANFGREHTFRVNQGEYGNRRFQYGGYWFGFVDAWPSNWLYTQDVYVIEINGVYYLCNAMYPGVNITLNVTL